MTIKEFQDKIKGKYEVSKTTINVSYCFKLGKKGCVTLQFSNDEFRNLIVDGKEKEEILKILQN